MALPWGEGRPRQHLRGHGGAPKAGHTPVQKPLPACLLPALVYPFFHDLRLGRQGQHGRARRARAEGTTGECPLHPCPVGPESPGLGFSRGSSFFHRETQALKAPLDSQDPRQVAASPAPRGWGGAGDKPRAAWARWGWPTGSGCLRPARPLHPQREKPRASIS